ncbi:undecaprenyl/decaprenyl-phosphate alpha-N-acetylglucosaminyl 1-phosphate transferase [Candidatus Microgenomates bacterium]|nr:undecaprenyl/decaprenyl-phosphate alpha-N-acetylglucosaminyl 1-phosphate transferase [Candidatus Microgenomates bacterium]
MVNGIFLGAFFISALIACAVTPFVIRWARALGVVDDPRRRPHPATLHKKPVPRGGGIPIFIALLFTTLIFLPLNGKLLAILAGSALILIIGLLDDRQHISPVVRLIANALAGILVVASGISILFVTNPLGGIISLDEPTITITLFGASYVIPIFAQLLAIVWIIAVTNIVSWSSGVDGQLSGFVPVAAATIGALSLRWTEDLTQWPVVILSLIVAGGYLGFLPWSVYPQRIMPGYSGGALAGFLLAVLTIISGAKVATALIVLGIPVMDALFTILRRIAAGKSPLWADTGHLHHRLLAVGWTKPQVATFYWVVAAILGFLVLHLNSQSKIYTIVMLAVLVGGLLLWLTRFKHLFRQPDQPIG